MAKKTLKFIVPVSIVVLVAGLGYPQLHQSSLDKAFQLAVAHNDIAQVRRLIDAGANVNAVDAGDSTPIMRASIGGYDDVARILIAHGANVKYKDPIAGGTALYYAAQYGFPGIVKMLISKGANVNEKTKSGEDVLDVTESARRVRSLSHNRTRPPTVQDFDRVIHLLKQAGAKPSK